MTLFLALLASGSALVHSNAHAEQTLEELQARLERAKKKNLILKSEAIERENIKIEAEAIERENAKLEASKPKKVSQTDTFVVTKHKENTASFKPVVSSSGSSAEKQKDTRPLSDALAAIPPNDQRREMIATYPQKTVYKSPSDVSPVSISYWDGVYVGINAGYGFNDAIKINSQVISPGQVYSDNNGTAQSGPANTVSLANGSLSVRGPLVGGQIGYNYVFANKFLLGGEIDMDYADVRSSGGYGQSSIQLNTTAIGGSGNSFIFGNNSYNRIGLDWLGTARIRLGYAAGNFLPYLTGGVAYGQLSSAGSAGFGFGNASQSPNSSNGFGFFNSNSTKETSVLQVGWALGAGAEYMIADGFSLRAEYTYTSIGGFTSPVSGIATNTNGSSQQCCGSNNSGSGLLGFGQTTIGQFGVHQFRGGLNYHIKWEPASTVVAKY